MIITEDELLDIVNDNDHVIGQEQRSTIYANGTRNVHIRVVNGFIKNSKGELWIPRRTASKNFSHCVLMRASAGTLLPEKPTSRHLSANSGKN